MSISSLPPPPPRPPHSLPPPPPPVVAGGTGSTWKDTDRPPSVPYPDASAWGLGDAMLATLIYFASSVVLVLLVVLVFDAEPLDGAWFPVSLIVPQILQFVFVVWTARRRGSGLSIDFGFAFAWKDLAIGPMLFFIGIMAAAVIGLTMTAAGVDPPTSAVAELTEEAVEGTEVDDGAFPTDAGDAIGADPDDADDGSGITVWIVIVAILAATAVPVIEELGYRGLWYSAMVKRGHSEWWAVVVSSFMFAIVHLEPARTLIIFALGMVLGWGRMLTNRIGASIIAHAIINGLAFAALLATLA